MAIAKAKPVSKYRVVRKERKLVYPGDVYVEKGQFIRADDIVARTEMDHSEPQQVSICSVFGIENNRIEEVLAVSVGDTVKKGDVLAYFADDPRRGRRRITSPYDGVVEYISKTRGTVSLREKLKVDEAVAIVEVAKILGVSPMFMKMFLHVKEEQEVNVGETLASVDGFGTDAVPSPVRGRVEAIDSRKGTVTIRRPYSPVNLYGYISGQVIEVLPGRGAIVETPACFIEGVFGVGGETFGELVVIAKSPEQLIDVEDILSEHAGKILICGAGITYEALAKALDLHVRGIIVGGFSNKDIVDLLGYEISSGTSGGSGKDFTVIATEGFGIVPMQQSTYDLLVSHQGKMTAINGITQIRAGVIRPEIIIPLEKVDSFTESDDEESMLKPRVGMAVQIISDPYFGQRGTITADGTQLAELPNGTVQELVSVLLDNGQEIVIGENNLRVVEQA